MSQETCLILRTCKPDMTSHGRFRWPKSGPVEAPDWDPAPVCGGGLHGLLWGAGNELHLDRSPKAVWLVFQANLSDVVYGSGKLIGRCKARRGVVVYCGGRTGAITYLMDHGARDKAVVYKMQEGGDGVTLVGGAYSTLTAGDDSTLTGGNRSRLVGGNHSVLTGGDYSTLFGGTKSTLIGGAQSALTASDDSMLTGGVFSMIKGGHRSILTGCYGSTMEGGNNSVLRGGDRCTLIGGDDSTLIAGDGSTLVGGSNSVLRGGRGSKLTGSYGSTLSGGYGSTLSVKYWDGTWSRVRTARVKGMDGGGELEPDTPYQVDYSGRFVRKEKMQ